MWNDTDIALAYLITFRCYGTWLHGDERGSIDRVRNQYKTPYISPNEKWYQYNAERLKHDPVGLDSRQRDCTEQAIKETCKFRDWFLRAINVRTNHVHVVVTAPVKPEKVCEQLKAWASRRLSERLGLVGDGKDGKKKWWTEKGDIEFVWDDDGLARVVDYVVNRQ